jgi:predicted RNA methylase
MCVCEWAASNEAAHSVFVVAERCLTILSNVREWNHTHTIFLWRFSMAKLTREETKRHEQGVDLVFGSDRKLSDDEIRFVLENWHPAAEHNVTVSQAFFTPLELALDMCLNIPTYGTVVDLGAGIGHLSWAALQRRRFDPDTRMVAVEVNPNFVEVGKRLLPEVEWHCANVLDLEFWQSLETDFSGAISNPPFGRTSFRNNVDTSWLKYSGPLGLMFAEVALRLAECGGDFILPDMQCPTGYRVHRDNGSGRYGEHYYKSRDEMGQDLSRFLDTFPYVHISDHCLEMSCYGGWRGVQPNVLAVDIGVDYPFFNVSRLTVNKAEDPVFREAGDQLVVQETLI